MSTDRKMLAMAANVAVNSDSNIPQRRKAVLGVVGLRNDGTLVTSFNGPSPFPGESHHAEARVVRKLDRGSEVWVARVKRDGSWGMAKPCPSCERRLRSSRVTRVVYTVGPDEFGVLEL